MLKLKDLETVGKQTRILEGQQQFQGQAESDKSIISKNPVQQANKVSKSGLPYKEPESQQDWPVLKTYTLVKPQSAAHENPWHRYEN